MACKKNCACCEGACCVDGTCYVTSCSACNDAGGDFQGSGTRCTEEGACPCDPPADHRQCEKCSDGSIAGGCSDGEHCCFNDTLCCVGECSECGSNTDCQEGYECIDCKCQFVGNCVDDEDCVEGCCVAGLCTSSECPTPYSISAGWCILTPTQYPYADINAYGSGSGCPDHPDGVTRYWMILNGGAPTEIQEPGGTYSHPVPGVSDPTGNTCRYVWVAYVGFGPTAEVTTQPTRCESKVFYLYLDVNRCSPAGGNATVVEDTGHDWGSWPSGCGEGCESDVSGCMSGQPYLTLSFAP